MRNAILMTFDDKYIKFLKTCINSIKANYPEHPTIYIYYSGINYNIGNYLRSLEKVETLQYSFQDRIAGFNKHIAYQRYRAWNPNELKDIDNILYLDCDTVVLDSLDELFMEKEFFIVSNCETHCFVNIFKPHSNIRRKLDSCYIADDSTLDMCNAGVFMIPRKYRTRMYYKILKDLHEQFITGVQYKDQSIISLWCHFFNIPIRKDKRSLSYNVQPSNSTIPNFSLEDEKLKILHFSGEKKPGTKEFLEWNWVLEKEKNKFINIWEKYA